MESTRTLGVRGKQGEQQVRSKLYAIFSFERGIEYQDLGCPREARRAAGKVQLAVILLLPYLFIISL
jgi:hypothetical protein